MKKTRIALLLMAGSWVLSGFSLFFFLPPFLKSQIEKKATQALGGPVTIGRLDILWTTPGFRMNDLRVQSEVININLQEISLRANWAGILDRSKLELALRMAKGSVDLPYMGHLTARGQPQTASEPRKLPVFATEIELQDVTFNYLLGGIRFGTYQIKMSPLDRKLNFDGDFQLRLMEPVIAQLPGRLKGEMEFGAQLEKISTQSIELSIAGLTLRGKGSSTFDPPQHDWTLGLEANDLSKLLRPPQKLPIALEAGGIKANFEIKGSAPPNLIARAHMQFANTKMQLEMQSTDMEVLGPLILNGALEAQLMPQAALLSSDVAMDFTATSLRKTNLFLKRPTVPLTLKFQGSGNAEDLQIKLLEAHLAQLGFRASGNIKSKPGVASQLDIEIMPTVLAGLEKILLPLSQTPLTGSLQAKAKIQGDLRNPAQLQIQLNPLTLSNVRGAIDYNDDKAKHQVSGPLSLNGRFLLDYHAGQILSADMDGQFDLSSLAIRWSDLFLKGAGQRLTGELKISQKKDALEVQSLKLQTAAGDVTGKGKVRNPKEPDLDLAFSTPRIDFGALAQWLPSLKAAALDGSAAGSLRLSGKWQAPKGLWKSPIKTQGQIKINLRSYKIASKPAAAKGAPGVSPGRSGDSEWNPMLESPLARASDLQVQTTLNRLTYGDQVFEGIKADGTWTQSRLQIKGEIQKVLGGTISNFEVKAQVPRLPARFEFKSKADRLRIESFLEGYLPEWKGLASGLTSGTLAGDTIYPSADMTQTTRVQGQIAIDNGYLSTLSFDKMVNEKLASLPQLGGQKFAVATREARGNIHAQFQFEKGRLNLSDMKIATPQGDELQAKGWMDLSKNIDMTGTASLTAPQVGGSVREANSDSRGRFVVPVHLKGNALKPDLEIASETIQKLISNTAQLEARKAGEKLKKQAESELKKQVGEQFKKILGH